MKTSKSSFVLLNVSVDEVYDSCMTMVVGAATKDFVVLTADGAATNLDDTSVAKRDFQKIFEIGQTIHFGFAANSVSYFQLLQLSSSFKIQADFSLPFTVYDIVTQFGEYARDCFASESDSFSIDFLVGGFDHDKRGNPTRPHIYFLSTDTGYRPTSKRGRQLYYAPKNTPDVLGKTSLGNDVQHVAEVLAGGIATVSEAYPVIGGLGLGVKIERDNVNWFRFNLDE